MSGPGSAHRLTLVATIPTNDGWRTLAVCGLVARVGAPDRPGDGFARLLSGAVVFVALYQGVVPLVARLVFDADQRFAPALWLPSPWWWIMCVAVVAVAVSVLAAIHTRGLPSPGPSGAPPGARDQGDEGTGIYDAAAAVVLLVGIYNGLAPFVARLVFDGNLLLALPLRLRAPWWWVTSIAVVIATVVLLALIDRAKQRRFPDG